MARPTPVIAVLAPFVGGYYFGTLISGVARAARAAGGAVLAIQTFDSGTENSEAENPRPRSAPIGWDYVDGFVVLLDSVTADEAARLAATGKPVVMVSEHFPGLDLPTIGPENAGGVRAAVTHLIEHGHDRIGFVGGGGNIDVGQRYDAYAAAMREHGIEPDPALRYTTGGAGTPVAHSEPGGWRAAQAMIAAGLPSTAVVCATDYNAIGVMRALQAAGYVVPRDQAIIGFDDTDIAARVSPPLATVTHHFEPVGHYAGQLVLGQLAGEAIARGEHRLPTEFVPRASCGCTQPPRAEPAGSAPAQLRLALSTLVADMPESVDAAASRLDAACTTVVEWAQAHVAAPSEATPATASTAMEAIAAIYRAAPRPETADAIVWALERFVASQGTGDGSRLVAEVAVFLSGIRVSEEFQVSESLERVIATQYEINIELLTSAPGGAEKLAWAEKTDASQVCLGLWESGATTEPAQIAIAGWYDRHDGGGSALGTSMDITAFPPRALLDRTLTSPDEVTFVMPVRGVHGDRGLLVAVGEIDTRSYNPRQTFNQWAALLGVALKHQDVLSRLTAQRTELKQAYERESSLRESMRVREERYAIALRAANDGLWDWDLQSGEVYYSDRCADILGVPPDTVIDSIEDWLARVHDDDVPPLRQAVTEHVAGAGDTLHHEHRVRRGAASYRWLLVRASVVRSADGRPLRMVGSFSDIDARRQLEEQLRNAASYDSLTGLPNRALFLDRLSTAIARSKRYPAHNFAVMFLDLDGFKVINDSLGHQKGDELLVAVANAIRESLRESDTGARFGGDEFAILLDPVPSLADVPTHARRMLARLAEPLSLHGLEVAVSASLGIALSSTGYTEADDVVRDADIAMYAAKSAGRGRFAFFDGTMHERALERLRIETEIRDAIEQSQLRVHYQPIVRLRDRQVLRFEALVHWQHPVRGLMPPADFLPLAEEALLLLPLGQWLLDHVCSQIAKWVRDGAVRDGVRVSVNVSHREFWHPGFADYLRATVERHAIPYDTIAIEIAESVLMEDAAAAREIVNELYALGVDVYLDDFGTGSSSLTALDGLPVQLLKIHHSFVSRARGDRQSGELIRALAQLGRAFGMQVGAVGIDDVADATRLAELGCEFGQGELFGHGDPFGPCDIARRQDAVQRAVAGERLGA